MLASKEKISTFTDGVNVMTSSSDDEYLPNL